MRTIRHWGVFLWPALLALLMSGCAVGRSTVEITPPTAINSVGGAYAKIVAVDDLRKFEASPGDPRIPSLENASEITDPSITARAVARKRGGFGKAFGDVVLPPGQSVAGLVRAAAGKALADKGYTVVGVDSPNYATAAPLSVDIVQFWAWFSPGFASVHIDFEGALTLRGSGLLNREPTTVTSHMTYEGMAIFESDWTDLVRRGVADLSQRMEETIKPAVAVR
jgi:hypothetical protein